ncbi:Crp/Fnr family transcriptional regulator [Ideonella sp. A 288]|uniref:Crp/Fnr family transcriptional regulator n=1 Tax=Ideonella sp. A 288 TaxID=1962181 RepID=UPI000B4B17A6|nr:Crp/Fnr family transcriptional regulator [Ideonella sp. A 288]
MIPTAPLADRLTPLYPVLDDLPTALRDEVLQHHATTLRVPVGQLLFEQGAPCRGFPMVLSGEVRVARGTPKGRSLELYRVTPGELCVASTSCLFGHTALVAHGATVADTELVVLTPEAFGRWTAHEPFRRYVFGIFADRLADLMALAEAVAFQRLDQRLAAALLGHGAQVLRTHQSLADELGTVREIVTRLLKRFERDGWIALGRERVDIVDAQALRTLAAGDGPR